MTSNFLYYFEKNTDAPGTNKGFYFQFLVTLKKWLDLDEDYQIFCETEDDIKVVDSLTNTIEFSQVKCYKTDFSFSSPEVKKSLCNFFILYQKYNSSGITFIFESNNSIIESDELLKKWKKYSDFFIPNLQKQCSEKVKSILIEGFTNYKEKREKNLISKIEKLKKKTLKREDAKSKNKFNIDEAKKELDSTLIAFNQLILKIDSDTFDFISKIDWRFGGTYPDAAIKHFEQEILAFIETGLGFSNGRDLIFSRLLSEVIKKSQETSVADRALNKSLLDEIIQESETEMIKNSLPEIKDLVSEGFKVTYKKLDIINDKVDETKEAIMKIQGFVTIPPAKDVLPFPDYEQSLIDDLNNKKGLEQGVLIDKIQKIGLGKEEENSIIEDASEFRANYLLYLDELKHKNLQREYKILKSLEKKVKYKCTQAISMIGEEDGFSSKKFWIAFEKELKGLLSKHCETNEYDLDEYFVVAQMYQKAAECTLRWKKVK